MPLTVASSYTAGVPRTHATTYRSASPMRRTFKGLGNAYWRGGDEIPPDAVEIALVAVRREGGHPSGAMLTDHNLGQAGRPFGLAVMYARAPLLWFALLFGSGWLGGYLTWRFLARR